MVMTPPTDAEDEEEMHRNVEWMRPSDRSVVREIHDTGRWIKPASLALNLPYSRQHIATRSKILSEHGILERYSDPIAGYRITDHGIKFLDDQLSAEEIEHARIYTGHRVDDEDNIVVANGRELDPRFDIERHSEDGQFDWGYEGDKPTQLAIALLADAEDTGTGKHLAQQFMCEVVADLDEEWELSRDEITNWIQNQFSDP